MFARLINWFVYFFSSIKLLFRFNKNWIKFFEDLIRNDCIETTNGLLMSHLKNEYEMDNRSACDVIWLDKPRAQDRTINNTRPLRLNKKLSELSSRPRRANCNLRPPHELKPRTNGKWGKLFFGENSPLPPWFWYGSLHPAADVATYVGPRWAIGSFEDATTIRTPFGCACAIRSPD